MEKAEEMVILRTESYKKLVYDAAQLEVLASAYKKAKGYVFDEILKSLFGEKEETEKC